MNLNAIYGMKFWHKKDRSRSKWRNRPRLLPDRSENKSVCTLWSEHGFLLWSLLGLAEENLTRGMYKLSNLNGYWNHIHVLEMKKNMRLLFVGNYDLVNFSGRSVIYFVSDKRSYRPTLALLSCGFSVISVSRLQETESADDSSEMQIMLAVRLVLALVFVLFSST